MPKVSVVMPVYNAGDYLVEAIESILNQTYSNFEFIIIDDASKDRSLDIIKRYKKLYPTKIRLIQMRRNLNAGGDMCANEGIKKARGKYIARMDADDISAPTRLEKQVEFLEENKKVFLVGSNAHVIDSNGEIIGEKLEPESPQDIYKAYLTFHPLIHPSCMFRRFIRPNKPFSYTIKYNANNDYYTFFKLICTGQVFANLPEKLLYYRIHGKNDTFVNMKKKFINTLKIRLTMIFKYGYKPTVKDIAVSIIQSAALFLLPDRILLSMYFISKGITKPTNTLEQLYVYFTTKPALEASS